MKKIVASILCLVLMMTSFAFAAEVFEKPEFNILVNGVEVDKTDVPIIIDGRTLVPLRTLAVALGVPNDDEHIIWNGETREVTVINEGVSIELTIDSTAAVVNGENKTIDVPATVYNGRTYLPARFVAEAFNKNVGWDEATATVSINNKVEDVAVLLKNSQEAMKNVKTVEVDMNMAVDIDLENMPLILDMNGNMSIDMNNKIIDAELDLNMNVMGLEAPAKMFMYMDDQKMYTKFVEDGQDTEWIEATETSGISIADMWSMTEKAEQIEMSEEFYSAFEYEGVDGNCTVVKTKDDLANMINMIAKQALNTSVENATLTNFDLTKLDYKMYINNSTNYTDKVEMTMAMIADVEGEKLGIDITTIMNMSKYNESLNIIDVELLP